MKDETTDEPRCREVPAGNQSLESRTSPQLNVTWGVTLAR